MLYMHHYALKPRREVLRARGPLRRGSVRTLERYRVVIRVPEGGTPGRSTQEYETRAKLYLLIRLKQLAPDDAFVRSAPLSVAFFDQWFELDDIGEECSTSQILDNLSEEIFSIPGNDPEALELRDAWLDRKANLPEARPIRYRVLLGQQVVGWIGDPIWGNQEIRGEWTATTNRAGKSLASSGIPAGGSEVVVEGYHYLRGRLQVDPSGVAVITDVRIFADTSPVG